LMTMFFIRLAKVPWRESPVEALSPKHHNRTILQCDRQKPAQKGE
jgi:hypothetical protein